MPVRPNRLRRMLMESIFDGLFIRFLFSGKNPRSGVVKVEMRMASGRKGPASYYLDYEHRRIK
jgi:hypothetical protein